LPEDKVKEGEELVFLNAGAYNFGSEFCDLEKLRTKIIGVYDNTIVVNASVYNSDLDALVVPVKLKVEGELDKGQGKSYVVKGVTPCSLDLFRYRVYLPEDKVKEGEELVFLNAGAYNFGSEFCDLEKLETEVV